MKLYLQLVGVAALAIAVSASAQQGTARIVPTAGQSTPTNAEQGQTPDTAGPTLKETSDWLKSTLEGYGGGCNDVQSYTKISDVSIDSSCRLSYKETFIWSSGVPDHFKKHIGDVFRTNLISIPLGAVSDVQAGIGSNSDCGDQWGIAINTGNVAAATINGSPNSNAGITISNRPGMSAGAAVPQSPAQMSPRIQKAIQHAVNLCRGTYQGPAPTKDPF